MAALLAAPTAAAGAPVPGAVTEFPVAAGSLPIGIAATADGSVWFAEWNGNQIGRITPTGTLTEFPISGLKPRGVAAGPDGNMWFTEHAGDRVARINPTTGVVTEFSVGITASSHPYGIAAGPDGNVWFTEFDGNRWGGSPRTGG